MYVVRARWGKAANAADAVHYLIHREERYGGQPRDPVGVGPRYEPATGNEQEIIRLLEIDALDIPEPRHYRLKLTLDDSAARRLSRLRALHRERVLREAAEAALKQALPLAQGFLVTHFHGGTERPWGHPHVHVHLGPRRQQNAQLRLRRHHLTRLREAWQCEIERALQRTRQRGATKPARPSPRALSPARDRLRAHMAHMSVLSSFLADRLTPDEEDDRRSY